MEVQVPNNPIRVLSLEYKPAQGRPDLSTRSL